MQRIKNRLLVFSGAIILCLLIFEVALRITGSIYASLAESDTTSGSQTGSTILCIGDSFTFGIGAPRELSYPAQLQSILNSSSKEQKYTVVNRGWPGQNSSQVLMRLEKYLQQFQPDIVTILIGAQNQVNYFGYREYLENTKNHEPGLLIRLHRSLDNIRTYKFFRLLFRNQEENWIGEEYPDEQKPASIEAPAMIIRHETPECVIGLQYKEKGEYDKALETILPVAAVKNVGAECLNIVGSIYGERHQYEEAVSWYQKGIAQDPGQFRNYEGIAQSLFDQGHAQEAIAWFEKGFANANPETLHPRCYSGISMIFDQTKDIPGAIAFFEKETERRKGNNPFLYSLARDYVSLFRNNETNTEIQKWVAADIEQMITLCRQYHARPFLQNYPFMPGIESLFKNIAKHARVPFVDQQSAFRDFTRNNVLNQDYFVPDGHPNAKGYEMMARNISSAINKEDRHQDP